MSKGKIYAKPLRDVHEQTISFLYEGQIEKKYKFGAGERKLLLAMIKEAVDNLLGIYKGRTRKESRRTIKEETKAWFESNKIHCDKERGISFAFACLALEIDPDVIREQIKVDLKGLRKKLRGRKGEGPLNL